MNVSMKDLNKISIKPATTDEALLLKDFLANYSNTTGFTLRVVENLNLDGDVTELVFELTPVASPIIHPQSVIFAKEADTVAVSATKQLEFYVIPTSSNDKTVSFSTSDATVATVDVNGVVTGLAVGTATITITTTDGALTDTIDITVS